MKTAQKKEPKRAWRQGLGSKVGKCDSPEADSNGLQIQIQAKGITMLDCPKWDSCNAPVCPLDSNWQLHRHLPGEPVCRWLREAVKLGSEPILLRALSAASTEQVMTVASNLISHKGPLKSRLERAAVQKSKSHAVAPWQRTNHVQIS